MTLDIKIPDGLSSWIDKLGGNGRASLFSVAAENLHRVIQHHLRRIAPARHTTADALGGQRTGHLEKGISGSSFDFDANHAEVTVPVAGINRAYGPVDVTAKNAGALTIPIAGVAYGKRVGTLRALGWDIFRPKGHDVLMGSLQGEDPVPLYVLKKRVQLKQDRSLMPENSEMNKTVARAMMDEIMRVARKAS